MLNKRIFVRKKEGFNIYEKKLLEEFKQNLNLSNLKSISYFVVYDIFNTKEEEFEFAKTNVFSEIVVDDIFEQIDLENKIYLSLEPLPNQLDQRAESAQECIFLKNPSTTCKILSGELLVFNGIDQEDLNKIKDYYINSIESRQKDLSTLTLPEVSPSQSETQLTNFLNLNDDELKDALNTYGLSLDLADLKFCQEYFAQENKIPTLGEIKVIDTYWSDHCRHTTFNTTLKNITINDEDIKKEYNNYLNLKKEISPNKDITLMDLATIYGKYASKNGILTNLEQTKEDNAISLIIKENNEEFLYQFKNETHNHPTEIEPFGGASTCIGGAIRDPLSGRAFVYQGLRISGSANILEKVEDTLPNKLPQRVISKKAQHGFSSYGNQIGLATTYVKELYHAGYKAKHLEAGAVVGIVKKSNVTREEPTCGDVILLLGGKTGLDGIGGATGSSLSHTKDSSASAAAEVQKGNAPVERKIQRLFMNPQATKLIKKSNDFGAGGISVAIGELAAGVDIFLHKVPLKVTHLKPSDIALSESQERMAVVLDKKDIEQFTALAHSENLEITHVATVTNTKRMTMYYNDEIIIDISRDFLNSGGSKKYQDVTIKDYPTPTSPTPTSLKDCFNFPNLVDNKNMEQAFDSTVGATTTLMPYGGKYEQTKEQVSVQKIPFMQKTTSHVSYGYNPYLLEANPYIGGQMAVVDSITKLIASGVKLTNINLSFQEYFKSLKDNPKNWGEVLATLLGTLKAQSALETPALGGKDSMSGTYEDISVPPTLISFAYGTSTCDKVISSTIQNENENIYILHNDNFNYETYKQNMNTYENLVQENKISTARSVTEEGIALCITKMLMGNKLGCEVKTGYDIFTPAYGSIIFTSSANLNIEKIGTTNNTKIIQINNEKENIEDLIKLNNSYFEEVYPTVNQKIQPVVNFTKKEIKRELNPPTTSSPNVFIPIFPGTNSEMEMSQAFIEEGCNITFGIFKNQTQNDITSSIDEFITKIENSHIIAIPGGFSGSDEPDGSGKYIVNFLQNEKVKKAIQKHLEQDKLILGICNGFQALIKSGLITTGEIGSLTDDDATLYRNDCLSHLSQIVHTKVMTTNSPWLKNLDTTLTYSQVISHGEGKIVASSNTIKKLFEQDQVAFCYENTNPNGSFGNIEGLISPCGKILGKMAHSERYNNDLYLNIPGQKKLNIFANATNYFKGE